MSKVPGAAYFKSLETKVTFTPDEIRVTLKALNFFLLAQDVVTDIERPYITNAISKINKALVKKEMKD